MSGWVKSCYVVCEELVGSAVCEELIKKQFGCTVGAEVVGPANGSEVIVSLVQRFASKMCVKCQVGSKNGYVVCEELVGSAVCEEHLLKNNLDAEVGPADGCHCITCSAWFAKVCYIVLGQKLASSLFCWILQELKNKFGCTVRAEVVGPADGWKSLYHLVQLLLQECVRCQV